MMFDSLPSRRQMYERYLLELAEAGEVDDWDDPKIVTALAELDDGEGASEYLALTAILSPA